MISSFGPPFLDDFAYLGERNDGSKSEEQKEHREKKSDGPGKSRSVPQRRKKVSPVRGDVVVLKARCREDKPLLPHADDNAGGNQDKQELIAANAGKPQQLRHHHRQNLFRPEFRRGKSERALEELGPCRDIAA